MQAFVFFISLPFLVLLSLLPFWALYRISDFLYVILYHVFGYRKKVVLSNLRNSFPEKTEEEIQVICKAFYSYLCDLILETIKTISMSKRQVLKRVSFKDKSIFEKLYSENRNIILVMGHYGNWELAGPCFTLNTKYQLNVIYKPLTNRYFEKLTSFMRTKFGTKITPMQNTLREMLSMKNTLNATAFIADQTPPPDGAHWMEFMNQDTPVFLGVEKLAKKLNYPIVFINITRPKRGYYLIETELLFENPKTSKDFEITESHTHRLEKEIRKQPEIWLWSHRRWKQKRK